MKWGNLTIFINHLMFSARRTRLLPVYWLSKHRFFVEDIIRLSLI